VSSVTDRLRRSPIGDAARRVWLARPVKRIRYVAYREPRNAELKDRHLGQRCFMVGNGPSILTQDLTLLRNEVVFCFNNFILHEQLHEIAPDYLCALDPAWLEPDLRQRWFHLHEERGTSAVTKLFNVAARRRDRKLDLFRRHEVYYAYGGSEVVPRMWELNRFPTDLTRPLAAYGIVFTDLALPAALYMGCKQIVMLGFDGGEIETLEDYVNYNFYGKDPLFSMEEYRTNFARFYGPGATHRQERAGLWERSFRCVMTTLAEHCAEMVNATPTGSSFPGIPRVTYEDSVSLAG
jgi:hypothetical protein